ncbi:peptidase E [Alicyclobacillus acidiphilus]|uniref:Type 1 glutamine amidotransferase-like domain-containing protein n=1 Tax=Alicyclobacillus acidiphilus TaxID=182455 RepID=UPI0008357E8C|nr:peptidase E [Alicyclobacillus acidiphilus]
MRHIIAMGGGGFSMEPENPLLDLYILKQTNKTRPQVCFLPTASGDADSYVAKFRNAFEHYSCDPSHLSLFRLPTSDLESYILEKDVIYVGGGNTKSMLALWREWGLDVILRKAWEHGVILAGLSAGSICWFEEGLTDSYGDKLMPLKCLGLLKGSNCPHYDGEVARRPVYRNYIQSGELQAGYAVDDGVALHFVETELARTVSSRLNAKAYFVSAGDGGHLEQEIETVFLGG